MKDEKKKELDGSGAEMRACVYTVIDAARMAEKVNGHITAAIESVNNMLHCSYEMAATCDNLGSVMWDLVTQAELDPESREANKETIKRCRDRVDGWGGSIKKWAPDDSANFPDYPTDETELEDAGEDGTEEQYADAELVREICKLSMQVGSFEKDIEALVFGDFDTMSPAGMRESLSNGLDFLSLLYAALPGYPGDDDATNDIKRQIWETIETLNENRLADRFAKLEPNELDAMLDRLSFLNGKLFGAEGREEYTEDDLPFV